MRKRRTMSPWYVLFPFSRDTNPIFISKAGEQVRGISADTVRGTYWIYTDQTIYELSTENEATDVWKIYLEKGQYDSALEYTHTASQRDIVISAQAQAYFEQGRYFQAAHCYSQSSVSFEDVALKFLDVGERDALRSYLVSRLERTQKSVSLISSQVPNTDLGRVEQDFTQRMVLATWLVEFYLSKCNELDDMIASRSISQDVENLQAERTILEEEIRHFFATYKV